MLLLFFLLKLLLFRFTTCFNICWSVFFWYIFFDSFRVMRSYVRDIPFLLRSQISAFFSMLASSLGIGGLQSNPNYSLCSCFGSFLINFNYKSRLALFSPFHSLSLSLTRSLPRSARFASKCTRGLEGI